jgi:glycosyltransferase involved in cell wall biosynthesis
MVLALAAAQVEAGDRCAAFLLNEGRLAADLRAAGVPVRVVSEEGHGLLALGRLLRDEIRRSRPDIVHAHRYKEVILSALARGGGRGPVLVRTIHGPTEWPRHLRARVRRAIAAAVEHWVGRRHFDAIACVSPELVRAETPRYGAGKVRFVTNGIQIARSSGAATVVPVSARDGKVVLFCGRLVQAKRVDIFVEMARRLASLRRDVTFVVIGDGPLRPLVEEAAGGTLKDRLLYLGFRPDARALFAGAAALVLTSDTEGMPIAVLEAMAEGAVVVSRAVGAIPTLLGDGSAGVLVGDDRPASFATAVMGLLDDPERAERLRSAAAIRAQQNYSAQVMAGQYRHLYLACLAGQPELPAPAAS